MIWDHVINIETMPRHAEDGHGGTLCSIAYPEGQLTVEEPRYVTCEVCRSMLAFRAAARQALSS